MLADLVAFRCTTHGEGPVWDQATSTLRFVDMLAGDLMGYAPATDHVTRAGIGEVLAAVRPRRQGGLVMALARGFALLDPTGEINHLGDLWSDRSVRMNDGGCDPQGRFYCGSMVEAEGAPAGSLYRLDPDGEVTDVIAGVEVSNGLAWSPDGSMAYYVDSALQRIDVLAFDADRGTFPDRRPLVRIPEHEGVPDGLTVDSDGGVWVALWGGGAVHRYRPDGRLDEVISVPVPHVSACAFGGTDLEDLYITTSRIGAPPEEVPEPAGSLFMARPGARGLPPHRFAG